MSANQLSSYVIHSGEKEHEALERIKKGTGW
jgi:hypothetical protein